MSPRIRQVRNKLELLATRPAMWSYKLSRVNTTSRLLNHLRVFLSTFLTMFQWGRVLASVEVSLEKWRVI